MNVPRVLAAVLVACGSFVVSTTEPTQAPTAAHASVALAVTLDELVEHSDLALVGDAIESRSVWETVGGSRRIVTYTQLASSEVVYGSVPSELWVRTLGGSVGRIGQQVSGEARIALGSRNLVFLTKAPDGALVVTARAQGHYRVVSDDDGTQRLQESPDVGAVVPRGRTARTARDELLARPVAQGVKLVAERRGHHDAPR